VPVRRALIAALPSSLLAACTPLGAFNALSPRAPGVRRAGADIAYGSLPRQRLDVYAPVDADRAPVLVFLYGGSWDSGRRQDYAFAGRAFAARGFVTVVPDYRLTSEAPYPAFLQDCAAAVAWAQGHVARFGGDPARMALAGHSAGAYNAAMLAMDERWLAAAGAPRPRAWTGLSGPYDFLPLTPGAGLRTFGAVEDLPSTQPITFASAGDPPAFLATGDKDVTVRPRNTRRLAERLRAAGVEVQDRVYPGAGHAELVLALSWPLSRRWRVLEDATQFLHRALA
jgi:acetyl esterase/lipase